MKVAQPTRASEPTKRKREGNERNNFVAEKNTSIMYAFADDELNSEDKENAPLCLFLPLEFDHSQNSSAPVSANASQSPPPRKVASRNISYAFSGSAPPKLMNPKKTQKKGGEGEDSQASEKLSEDGYRSPT